MYAFARSLLFCLDAERAYDLGLQAIEAAYRTGCSPLLASASRPLPIRAFGIEFPNPVGLAAGLDKNGDYFEALAALGFGFVEIGTITPKPQPGNPRPRIFRLSQAEAVINRLGFNNKGVDYLVERVERSHYKGVLGINIGKNKDTLNENAIDDYLFCLDRVYALASYITINISSPNTPGLRDLQQQETLHRLVAILRERQEKLAAQYGQRKPILLKIAPDLNDVELDNIANTVLANAVDGVICTNTTIDRSTVIGKPHADEAGGLSGRPLFGRSTQVLQKMVERLNGQIPVVGVGGILQGADAAMKIQAGASLVQFYTGMIYRGPALITESIEAIQALR